MQSFAKVLSRVSKKLRQAAGDRPRILLPVDSRVIVLGKPGIAIVANSAGQGLIGSFWGVIPVSGAAAWGQAGTFFTMRGANAPDLSGRSLLACRAWRLSYSVSMGSIGARQN